MKNIENDRDPYEILGVSQNASDDEIKRAYRALVKQYHPDGYDGNPLADLAKEKMQQINWAYDEIQRRRKNARDNMYSGNGTYYQSASDQSSNQGYRDPIYNEIRIDINSHRFADAERKLLSVPAQLRIAEWHYLMSLVLMSRKNGSDAMRELEIACSLDPSNEEYQRAKEMFNTSAGAYGSTYYGSAGNARYRRRTNADDACDCCLNLMCLDCICECLGGDLISCC